MAKYLLLALNGPTSPDVESIYNRWYEEVHLPDLQGLEGVTSARRFKVIQSSGPWPYAAAYEIETDDMADLLRRMEHDIRPFDPTFDRSKSAHILAIAL